MTHQEALALIDNPYFRHPATSLHAGNPALTRWADLENFGGAASPRSTSSATFVPTRWADLGCGTGTFTLALAELLAPGSIIEAIDLQPSVVPQTTSNGVTIYPRAADFTTLDLELRDDAAMSEVLPPRAWPGRKPLAFHGILMANSLHYVKDQRSFLQRLHRIPAPDSTHTQSAPDLAHSPSTPTSTHSPNTPGYASRRGALLLVEYDIEIAVARWVPYPLSFAKATQLLHETGWPNMQKLGTHPSAFGRSDLYAALALPQE